MYSIYTCIPTQKTIHITGNYFFTFQKLTRVLKILILSVRQDCFMKLDTVHSRKCRFDIFYYYPN